MVGGLRPSESMLAVLCRVYIDVDLQSLDSEYILYKKATFIATFVSAVGAEREL